MVWSMAAGTSKPTEKMMFWGTNKSGGAWFALWKSSRKLDTASKGQKKQNCESESKKIKENDASKESHKCDQKYEKFYNPAGKFNSFLILG